jgi:hypothetical protein
VPSKLESAVVTVEAWVTGTANNAIATRNNQAIFFFMKFSSSGLVLCLLDRGQGSRKRWLFRTRARFCSGYEAHPIYNDFRVRRDANVAVDAIILRRVRISGASGRLEVSGRLRIL